MGEKGPSKKQRIATLEKEVSELKLIVHELRGSSTVVEEVLTQGQEGIEFEGKLYRKVGRKAREGDVVIFSNLKYDTETINGKPYKVEANALYKSEEGTTLLVYGWEGQCPKPEVYELIPSSFVEDKLKSPNQLRAEIIEKAKRFFSDHDGDKFIFTKVSEKNATFCWNIISNGYGFDTIHGLAVCNPSDVFNEHIGKAIALGRALKLDVSEFEQAVQPTVAVGQIIQSKMAVTYKVNSLEDSIGNVMYSDEKGNWHDAVGGYLPKETWYTIINDTNAIYGGVE